MMSPYRSAKVCRSCSSPLAAPRIKVQQVESPESPKLRSRSRLCGCDRRWPAGLPGLAAPLCHAGHPTGPEFRPPPGPAPRGSPQGGHAIRLRDPAGGVGGGSPQSALPRRDLAFSRSGAGPNRLAGDYEKKLQGRVVKSSEPMKYSMMASRVMALATGPRFGRKRQVPPPVSQPWP